MKSLIRSMVLYNVDIRTLLSVNIKRKEAIGIEMWKRMEIIIFDIHIEQIQMYFRN